MSSPFVSAPGAFVTAHPLADPLLASPSAVAGSFAGLIASLSESACLALVSLSPCLLVSLSFLVLLAPLLARVAATLVFRRLRDSPSFNLAVALHVR